MGGYLTAVLANQAQLADHARRQLGDFNEASLVVGKVVAEALNRKSDLLKDDALCASLREELDALIAARRTH